MKAELMLKNICGVFVYFFIFMSLTYFYTIAQQKIKDVDYEVPCSFNSILNNRLRILLKLNFFVIIFF